MGKIKHIISILTGTGLLLLSMVSVQAQSNAKIENIDFTAEFSKLVITYDIVKAKSGETFEIWFKVLTVSGKELIPSSAIGDVGKGVTGEPNKRIVWDVEADNVVLDEEFSVEIFARSQGFQGENVPEKELEKEAKSSGISVGGALALSALLPGLGNRVVKGSGAQWLLGVVGYGCVAGSILMNNAAYNSYEDYKIATTTEERDDLFKQAKTNNSVSKVFMGMAIVIWAGDLLWTGLQAGNARKKAGKSVVSFIYSYDPNTKRPLIGIHYRF